MEFQQLSSTAYRRTIFVPVIWKNFYFHCPYIVYTVGRTVDRYVFNTLNILKLFNLLKYWTWDIFLLASEYLANFETENFWKGTLPLQIANMEYFAAVEHGLESVEHGVSCVCWTSYILQLSSMEYLANTLHEIPLMEVANTEWTWNILQVLKREYLAGVKNMEYLADLEFGIPCRLWKWNTYHTGVEHSLSCKCWSRNIFWVLILGYLTGV